VHVAELRLSSERRGDTLIVGVAGELDIVTSRKLDEHLAGARRKERRIVLDLKAVEFMDTSALAVIVGHWKRLEGAGGTLVLAGPRYRYTKTLWITGLAERLPLYDSVDEALAGAQPADSRAVEGQTASPEQVPPAGRAAADATGVGRRSAPG
jgi:anti-sigma B factor antagonist